MEVLRAKWKPWMGGHVLLIYSNRYEPPFGLAARMRAALAERPEGPPLRFEVEKPEPDGGWQALIAMIQEHAADATHVVFGHPIETFVIDGYDSGGFPASFADARFPRLAALVLHHVTGTSFAGAELPELRTLLIQFSKSADLRASIASLAGARPPMLERLTLDVRYHADEVLALAPLFTEDASPLRELSLIGTIDRPLIDRIARWPNTRNLRSLKLLMHVDKPYAMRELEAVLPKGALEI